MRTTPTPTPPAPPRTALAALLAAAAALGAVACHGPTDLETEPARLLGGIIATCSATVRDVQIRRAGQTDWEPAMTGATLRAGDEVKTGPSSSARLALLSGGALELEESAAVVVGLERPDDAPPRGGRPLPRSSSPDSRVDVRAGVVRGLLSKAQAGRATPGVVILSSDGSSIRVASRPGEDATVFRLVKQEIGTEIAVVQGAASVRGSRGDTVLSAGNAAVVRAGALAHGAPLTRAPALVAPEADARFQLSPGLAVRLRWDGVAGATGYRVQIARDLAFRDVEAVETVDGSDFVFVPRAAGEHAWRVATRDDGGRYGEYGPARRLHCEERTPQDQLERPADAAVVRSGDGAAQVTFSWRGVEDAAAYRLVLARSPELLTDPVTSVVVQASRGVLEIPAPGDYWWGVYLEAERDPRPLFTKARRITVRKGAATAKRAPKAAPAPAMEVPRAISQWGG